MAIFAALSYPIFGANAVTNINELSKWSLIFNLFALIPFTQYWLKFFTLSANISIDCNMLWAIKGLKTFSSKWPWVPAIDIPVWFPITLTQTMVTASHWVGLTLPGMIEDPGSFSGNMSSP